jgi:hypothetical protein
VSAMLKGRAPGRLIAPLLEGHPGERNRASQSRHDCRHSTNGKHCFPGMSLGHRQTCLRQLSGGKGLESTSQPASPSGLQDHGSIMRHAVDKPSAKPPTDDDSDHHRRVDLTCRETQTPSRYWPRRSRASPRRGLFRAVCPVLAPPGNLVPSLLGSSVADAPASRSTMSPAPASASNIQHVARIEAGLNRRERRGLNVKGREREQGTSGRDQKHVLSHNATPPRILGGLSQFGYAHQ